MEEATSTMLLLFSILISFSTWMLIHRWNQRFHRGPKTWPLIGATIEQIVNYDRMHDWIVNYLKELKTVAVPMLSMTYTYTADPANVEYILKSNFNNYPKGELYASCMDVLLGDGIFNADGEMWKKQRKTSSFEFASKNLRDFSTIVFRDYAMVLSSILCQASSSIKALMNYIFPVTFLLQKILWVITMLQVDSFASIRDIACPRLTVNQRPFYGPLFLLSM